MRAIDENTITDAVLEQTSSTPDARLKLVMDSLVRHLHAFARDVDLTPDEWLAGIRFLTEVGQKCTRFRQEFVLLSDTLGFSSMVNALHDRRATESCTKSSLLGPFYRQDAPVMKLGESIVTKTSAPQICVYGKVVDASGKGIPNALVQVWEPDETGHYDLQRHDPGEMDLRGRFHTDPDGGYYFRAVCPLGYMIPMDGPVGDMIRAQGRHGYRPAHIHFLIGAPGYREVVTALYISGDDHLESDTVFGVSESLITTVKDSDPASPLPNLPSLRYDFQLAAVLQHEFQSGRVGTDPSQITTKAG